MPFTNGQSECSGCLHAFVGGKLSRSQKREFRKQSRDCFQQRRYNAVVQVSNVLYVVAELVVSHTRTVTLHTNGR